MKPSKTDKYMVLRVPHENVDLVHNMLRERMVVVGLLTPVAFHTIVGSGLSEPAQTLKKETVGRAVSAEALDHVRGLFATEKIYLRSSLLRKANLSHSSVDNSLRILVSRGEIRRVANGHYKKVQQIPKAWSETGYNSEGVTALRAHIDYLGAEERVKAESVLGQFEHRGFLTGPQWRLLFVLLSHAKARKIVSDAEAQKAA